MPLSRPATNAGTMLRCASGKSGTDDSVKAPFVFENAKSVCIFAGIDAVDPGKGTHDLSDTAFDHCRMKAGQVNLAQCAFADLLIDSGPCADRRIAAAALLLRVGSEVLHSRQHVIGLQCNDFRTHHARYKKRIFAEALSDAAEMPGARNIHGRTDSRVQTCCKELLAEQVAITLCVAWIKAGGNRKRRRKGGYAGHAANTGRSVGATAAIQT